MKEGEMKTTAVPGGIEVGEKVEVKLQDAFGSPYYRDLLPREKVEEILKDLDIEEVVKLAYGAYCPGLARGECQLSMETGELVSANYTTGSGDIQGMHYITLYVVPQNLDLPNEDLFSDEDYEQAKAEDLSIWDYAEYHEIDMEERELEALTQEAYEEIYSEDWWSEINAHLDAVYGEVE